MDEAKPIETEQDYQEALKLAEELISRDPDPDSVEGKQLNLLSVSIQDYENKLFPKVTPDPAEAAKFRRDQMGLS